MTLQLIPLSKATDAELCCAAYQDDLGWDPSISRLIQGVRNEHPLSKRGRQQLVTALKKAGSKSVFVDSTKRDLSFLELLALNVPIWNSFSRRPLAFSTGVYEPLADNQIGVYVKHPLRGRALDFLVIYTKTKECTEISFSEGPDTIILIRALKPGRTKVKTWDGEIISLTGEDKFGAWAFVQDPDKHKNYEWVQQGFVASAATEEEAHNLALPIVWPEYMKPEQDPAEDFPEARTLGLLHARLQRMLDDGVDPTLPIGSVDHYGDLDRTVDEVSVMGHGQKKFVCLHGMPCQYPEPD